MKKIAVICLFYVLNLMISSSQAKDNQILKKLSFDKDTETQKSFKLASCALDNINQTRANNMRKAMDNYFT